MIKVVLLYTLMAAGVGGVVYGIPAFREAVGKIDRMKIIFAVCLGFFLTVAVYLLETGG